MERALTDLFETFSHNDELSFSDFCCFLRGYGLFDTYRLDHLEVLYIWEAMQGDFPHEDDEEMVVGLEYFPHLLDQVARALHEGRRCMMDQVARALHIWWTRWRGRCMRVGAA